MQTRQCKRGDEYLNLMAVAAVVLSIAVLAVMGFQSLALGQDYAGGFGSVRTCPPTGRNFSLPAPNQARAWGYCPRGTYPQPYYPQPKGTPPVRDLFFRPQDAPYLIAEPYRLDGRYIPVTRSRAPSPLVGYWWR